MKLNLIFGINIFNFITTFLIIWKGLKRNNQTICKIYWLNIYSNHILLLSIIRWFGADLNLSKSESYQWPGTLCLEQIHSDILFYLNILFAQRFSDLSTVIFVLAFGSYFVFKWFINAGHNKEHNVNISNFVLLI